MWASITDGGPTLTQVWFKASCWYRQHEVLTRAEWILPSTGDLFCLTYRINDLNLKCGQKKILTKLEAFKNHVLCFLSCYYFASQVSPSRLAPIHLQLLRYFKTKNMIGKRPQLSSSCLLENAKFVF